MYSQALSSQALKADSVREVEGWLWNTDISALTEHEEKLSQEQYQELTLLLARFPQVFQEISRLAPHQNIVHSIVLQEGAAPISVRPYRYPHHHKTEIERQVNKMLNRELSVIVRVLSRARLFW